MEAEGVHMLRSGGSELLDIEHLEWCPRMPKACKALVKMGDPYSNANEPLSASPLVALLKVVLESRYRWTILGLLMVLVVLVVEVEAHVLGSSFCRHR